MVSSQVHLFRRKKKERLHHPKRKGPQGESFANLPWHVTQGNGAHKHTNGRQSKERGQVSIHSGQSAVVVNGHTSPTIGPPGQLLDTVRTEIRIEDQRRGEGGYGIGRVLE